MSKKMLLLNVLVSVSLVIFGLYYAWILKQYDHACFDLILAGLTFNLMEYKP